MISALGRLMIEKGDEMKILCIIGVVCIFMLAQPSYADELKLRGGLSKNLFTDYPYALDYETESIAINSRYGKGVYGSATYSRDKVVGDVGLDFSLQFGQLKGSDNAGDTFDGECEITTFLGLIDDCQDTANTRNRTTFGDISILANFPIGDTTLLIGPSYMAFENDLDAEYLYFEGFENFVSRNTEFSGVGFKVGAQHVIRIKHGFYPPFILVASLWPPIL